MRFSLIYVALSLVCSLSACGDSTAKDVRNVPSLHDTQAKLAFTCIHEADVLPPRDPEADKLYRHARWLYKNNRLKEDPAKYPEMERLLRIATAWGHDKANLELRLMISRGRALSNDPVKESLDLTEDLIRRGIPSGYYDMGRYLETGMGVERNPELALKYYRKSADMGSPFGQYLVGEKLAPIDMAPDIARQMWRCAAEQGYGAAAEELGIDFQNDKLYPEALEAYQLGVKAGNSGSALSLRHAFESVSPDDEFNYLALASDPERVRRYKIIEDFLSNYSYLNPVVPDLDDIVPLPPAELPPWDGKLQWLEEHKANVPPPLPSEARIEEMARAKGLDPKTGRPSKPQ